MRLTRVSFFFFNDPATTEIYTLSLHDALPIYASASPPLFFDGAAAGVRMGGAGRPTSFTDRKSTRLNSSHLGISYAVFCLKKKTKPPPPPPPTTPPPPTPTPPPHPTPTPPRPP